MDIEKLTKQQIVLVTLLVSFVTSIATGIVTVALMDQAPPGVTQTINRVVERTIEKVVTPPTSNNSASIVTKETVVVKEDDMIIKSIDKNKNSVVRIYTNTSDASDTIKKLFIGLGTIVSNDGLIMTGDIFADTSGEYQIMINDKSFEVKVLPKNDGSRLYFLKVKQDAKNQVTFTPITFSDSDNLKLGQSVISWGGREQNSISTGIISSLSTLPNVMPANIESTSTETITAINASTNLTESLTGGPLLNLNGDTVGIRVSTNILSGFNFLPSNILKSEVANYAAIQ